MTTYPTYPAPNAYQNVDIQSDSLVKVVVDSTGLTIQRSLSEGWQHKYNGPDFHYQRPEGQAENVLARFLRWLSNWLSDTFGLELSPETLSVLEFAVYVLLGALAIYLLVRYLINAPFGQLFSSEATELKKAIWIEEELEQIDLDALLSEAVKTRDYRLAIRYRYLQLLRYLSRSGRIDYHPEKTNWDYLAEISDSRLKVAFSKASRVYEYTWYGEQAVDQHGYEGIEHLFDPARETNHQRHE